MIGARFLRQVQRFCIKKQDIEQQAQSTFLTDAQKKFDNVPIHLRAYDKSKYQVPLTKIKKNSGYSMVQIQPFPRARIMKICYNLLSEIRKGIPETDMFRIYNEQKFKYVMQLTDKEQDVEQLQKLLACPTIQVFIRNLANQFEIIDSYRNLQPWNMSKEVQEQIDSQFVNLVGNRQRQKYPLYRRPQRVKHSIL